MSTQHEEMDDRSNRRGRPAADQQAVRLRRLLLGGAELLVAVILVFVFFLSFLGIISFSFPQGTSFRALMVNPRWVERAAASPKTHVEPVGRDHDSIAIAARLVSMRRLVKTKEAHAIAWSGAQFGMKLNPRDSVQTFDNSSARIEFTRSNRVDLGENSLIVLRRPERRMTAESHSTRIAFGGALAAFEEVVTADGPFEMAVANGAYAILPGGARDSHLAIKTNPDNTSTFSVFSGTARVVSGGREVELSTNQGVTVDGATVPPAPVSLPARPKLSAPVDGARVTYRSAAPLVRMKWEDEPGCEGYHVVVGRDPDFESIVYEGEVGISAFEHGNLPPGRYYWKVSGLSGYFEGPASPARRLDLYRDDAPPELRVQFPDRVTDGQALITGTTEPGAEVFIGDHGLRAGGDGVFEYAVNLERGVNLIVVEAIDAAGNVAYRSELIHAEN